MTHCDGDDCHFFCLDCAKRNADNEIGQSRYKLRCMDGSGCTAEFSRQQVQRFLDDKTLAALARIQQDDEIRMAELDGLAKCPFCDFAAICPPVEIDREFRCRNSECERTSCRLCRQETHIPLSCKDFAKENRATIRHAVEEAMTEALVRSCK
jgi:TRIAD3 protein (E3 ubiquitin-protein ligase RNF216)